MFTDIPKKEDPLSLATKEEPEDRSNDSSLDNAAKDDSTPGQKDLVTETKAPLEVFDADIIESTDKGEKTEEKDLDDDVEPVRPEQRPRGRVKPPVSGPPKPKPK